MANLKYTVDIDTKGAKSSLASLERSIGGLGATLASGFAVTEIVNFADSITSLKNKLSAFSSSQDEVNAKFNKITEIAGRARSDFTAVGDLYGKMTVASQALGLSQDQVAQITETFTKSLKVGGATAQESASAILQFSQAMGSGVLRGEEFNAVMEASPSTMMDLAKALNVPVGSLRKLAEEGKLTSKVVSQAMLKMQTEVENKFKKTVPTIQDALNNVKTASAIAFNQLSQEPGPAQIFIKAANAVIQLTSDVNQLAGTLKSLFSIVAAIGLIFAGNKAVSLAKVAFSEFAGLVTGKGGNIRKMITGIVEDLGRLGGAFRGIGSAFGEFQQRGKGAGYIMSISKDSNILINTFNRLRQVLLSVGSVFSKVISIGARFAGLVGVFMLVVEVVNLLYKAINGTNENLIDMGKIFKFVKDLVKILWWAMKGLADLIKTGLSMAFDYLASSTGIAGNIFRGFLNTLGMTGIVIKTVIGWISALWGKLGEFWGWLKEKSGVAAQDRKDALDKQQADLDAMLEEKGLGKTKTAEWLAGGKGTGQGTINLPGGTGKGGGKSAKEIAEEQKAALAEVKKAVLEVTAAYREQASARLADLNFQLRSLTMSEEQIQLEQTRTDILNENKEALKQLADKELEVKNNKDLSNKGRQEALALIAQEKASIEAATEAQLAAAEKEIKAIQAKNREIERNNHLLDLQQKAVENKAALQALEDQLQLVGLYGDELDNVTAQLELQNKLREIDVDFQGQLVELKKEEKKLGEELYNQRKRQIEENRDLAINAATQEATTRKKISDAIKKSERTDVNAAIRKRLEELARSVDPTILAVQSLESAFSNMSSAIDNFVDTGKFKFGDFARSVIADIAKIQLKAAATKILGGIFSKIFAPSIGSLIPTGSKLTSLLPASFKPAGYAAGGPVKGNNPYIVGEQGPELFVPNSNGSIMTNASLNKNAGMGAAQPVVNNTYITNNISAIDSRSVAQMFVENRKSLLGASLMARKEMPYGS